MNAENYFPVPSFRETDFKSFISYWSNYYDYNLDKQTKYYLEPIEKEQLTKDDLLLLFEWKNGSKLSSLKRVSFDNKVGKLWNEINLLKAKGITCVGDVQAITPDLSPIWLIFLTHIIDKENFPIYDMHVFRAHHYLMNKTIEEIPNNNKQKLGHYNNYLAYYNSLKSQIGVHKEWDEAMWGFGKYLSRFKNISNEEIR